MDLQSQNLNTPGAPAATVWRWLALVLAAALCYLSGLDSLYLPSNGDEMVYSRIARLTAHSGQWLPLVSDLDHMRNTKPPLLFWQAMAAGDGGLHWDLWRLRLPAVLYSLALTACLAWTTWLVARRRDAALISAAVYLAFFSSFRYGRPYLTSAAESFWLTLPLWLVLWRRAALPGWASFAGFGLLWGLGLLYKSFALVLPTSAGLWCVLLVLHGRADLPTLWRISLRTALSAVLALAVFGLWFVLDPDPAAVWQEFVLGENAGKMAASGMSLSAKAVAISVQALAWLENAGPLALVMLGLMMLGLAQLRQGWRTALAGERTSLALAAWALVWLIVFCLPSQRSARYVIPAMPALAVLIALHWQRLPRRWFAATLLLCLPVLLLLGCIGWSLHAQGVANLGQTFWVAALSLAGLSLVVIGLLQAHWQRACALAASLSLYALLNAVLAPLSGPAGHFSVAAGSLPAAARVAVPSSFNAQYERYQFLLPEAASLHIAPYAITGQPDDLAPLLRTHDAVVWLSEAEPDCSHQQPAACRLLSSRWDIRSRHRPGEIRWGNLFQPEQWLLRREWLLAAPPAPAGT